MYSPDLFDRNEEVLLTQDEQDKLATGRNYYESAMEKLNKSDKIFLKDPIYNSVTSLYAGELTKDVKEGITDYFNSFRASSGYSIVNLEEEGFDVAQHLATLIKFTGQFSHMPTRPAGISDNFYNTAVGWGKSWGSDLSAGYTDTVRGMINHINGLIDDRGSLGNKYNYGHRRDMTKPTYSKFGFGCNGGYGVVELSGVTSAPASYDGVRGLPAVNGVTFLENLEEKRFTWSAQFEENKYLVRDNCTTTVKCLNTGKTWNFSKEEDIDGRLYQNIPLDNDDGVMKSCSNKILFYEHDIEPVAGYVYQVTINGLQNKKTEKIESYTYRTVFENADVEKNPESFNTVKIEVPEELEEIGSKVYTAEVDTKIKLYAKLDKTDVADIKITWTSSDSDSVSVTQNGLVTINKVTNKDVTIRVYSDKDNSILDQIIIRPKEKEKEPETTPTPSQPGNTPSTEPTTPGSSSEPSTSPTNPGSSSGSEQSTTPGTSTTPEQQNPPTPKYKLGDVDENGDITVSDAIMVLQHVAKNNILTGNQLLAADVEKVKGAETTSESITVSDAIKILQYVAKNISSFD